ncbi:FKBP-type peptidyl-prolyl cis-trans isomerase, partial [bacterium]
MPLAALTLLLASQGTAAPTAPARTPSAAVAPAAVPRVKTTDLAPGTGAVAIKPGDLVEVNYVGKLTDGKEFDRSKDVPFRVQVGLGKVIAGWDQGLLGMKVGGKRRLEIPASLGYGAQGAAPVIPPNADLDFEVGVRRDHGSGAL